MILSIRIYMYIWKRRKRNPLKILCRLLGLRSKSGFL